MIQSGTDPKQTSHFDALAQEWRDPEGPMKPLHWMNQTRIAFIRNTLEKRYPDHQPKVPFNDKICLDVGCGAGLLSEPMTRLGANVTGIDPSEEAIKIAQDYAVHYGLDIRYLNYALDDVVRDPALKNFDFITALEVIEHVPDPAAFIQQLSQLMKPDGVIFLSTLNRTVKSFLEAIVGAEYVLGLLPKGTHQWRAFFKPHEVRDMAEKAGLKVIDLKGLKFNLGDHSFELSERPDTNYIMALEKI